MWAILADRGAKVQNVIDCPSSAGVAGTGTGDEDARLT
jgi:hypothetical protein